MNKNSTRYFSSKQEKQIAKVVGGKVVANSGATLFDKGDVKTNDWLFEAKTCTKEQEQFTIKREWLNKIREEKLAMRKDYSSLVFNFGPDTENYYVLDERTFKILLENLTFL